uniref:Uncharacterized protein n=1 Tax=Anguilla anguilla TaxID=7936 RepID=A0A0E9TDP8_ANGAN
MVTAPGLKFSHWRWFNGDPWDYFFAGDAVTLFFSH